MTDYKSLCSLLTCLLTIGTVVLLVIVLTKVDKNCKCNSSHTKDTIHNNVSLARKAGKYRHIKQETHHDMHTMCASGAGGKCAKTTKDEPGCGCDYCYCDGPLKGAPCCEGKICDESSWQCLDENLYKSCKSRCGNNTNCMDACVHGA